jgi:sarcosine oxidase, subunit beta
VADRKGSEVLILGAGVLGCSLAYHLTRRKITEVTVYDPRTPAAGASGRAAGVLTEQLWDRWDVEVTRETTREYAELCRTWEPSAFQQNGFVRFTAGAEAATVLDETRERLRSWGVRVEEASASDLTRWIPEGRFDDLRAAMYGPHDACVTPSSITTIYAELARKAGVTFDFGRPMESLAPTDGGWSLGTPNGTLGGRHLVVAAGAWSKRLLADLGHPLPMTPYRTQAGLLRPPRPRPEGFPTFHDIDTDIYVRPEANGRLLAGDGTESVEADPERFVTGGDERFLHHLAEGLTNRLPGWAESDVLSSWAGVCTSTPDRHPIVGPVPGARDLFVLTGFNGFGVMRAGGTARRMADLLADGEGSNTAREALLPAWPGRFSGPVRSFPPRPGFTLEGGDNPRF